MAKKIFVTATNTDVGKTFTTKLLLKEFSSRGISVGVIKPVETGVIDGYAPDGEELLSCVREFNTQFKNLSVEDIVPITYELAAAPFVASKNQRFNLDKIDRAIKKLEEFCEVLVIEGAGGLFVPLYDNYMMIDLIKYLKASALLVTHCSLGCINDTLLSKKVLQDSNIAHAMVFNCKNENEDKSFEIVSEPYFKQSGIEVLKIPKNIDTLCDVLYNL